MIYFDDTAKPCGNSIIDLQRVADLGAVPITLAEAKEKLIVDHTDFDSEITALIKRAIRYVENYCNISIIYQRIQLIGYLESEWKLPYGPVIGLESVATSEGPSGSAPISYSPADAWTMDGGLFWPSTRLRHKIVYTAGNYLPDDLKDACLQVLTFLFENRGKDYKVEGLKTVLKNADNYFVTLWI